MAASRTNNADSVILLFRRILLVCPAFTLVSYLLLGILFFYIAGQRGVLGVLLSGALSVFFMSSTVLSMIVAGKFRKSPLFLTALPLAVMSGWVAKIVVSLIFVFSLKNQMWFDGFAFFLCTTLICVGSLVIDTLLVLRSGVFDSI